MRWIILHSNVYKTLKYPGRWWWWWFGKGRTGKGSVESGSEGKRCSRMSPQRKGLECVDIVLMCLLWCNEAFPALKISSIVTLNNSIIVIHIVYCEPYWGEIQENWLFHHGYYGVQVAPSEAELRPKAPGSEDQSGKRRWVFTIPAVGAWAI